VSVLNLVLSQLLTFVFLGLTVAAVLKLFQLATDLTEIKDILAEMRRSVDTVPAHVRKETAVASPVELVRAVNAEGMDAADAYAENLLKPPGSF
jgi:hypothetical protein